MVAVGPTVTPVNVGLTKKPVHPIARASRKRIASAANSGSWHLIRVMIENPAGTHD